MSALMAKDRAQPACLQTSAQSLLISAKIEGISIGAKAAADRLENETEIFLHSLLETVG